MASTKKYWKNEAELNPNDSTINKLRYNEFPEEIPVDEFLGDSDTLSESNTSRRDFLKYVGFSTAAASMAACEGPVRRSIPYVMKPDTIVPGIANYYATTIANGFDFASILVKTREGRPIKIERNIEAGFGSHSSARIQASVLSLYDSSRLQGPKAGDQDISWEVLDATVRAQLNLLKSSDKQIAFLTPTYASPSTAKLIEEFQTQYPNTKHVIYDAISEDAALDAFEAKFGTRALPDYRFENADVIVSFGADFLGDWQGGGYSSGYAKGRVPKEGKMSKHIQFESNMTLTGANADHRIALTPSEQKKALASLFGTLNNSNVSTDLSDSVKQVVQQAAKVIGEAGSKAVVVTGIDDVNAQSIALAINELIGSEVVDSDAPRNIRQGNTKELGQLVQDMNDGNVGLLIMDDVNPMYTLADTTSFESGLSKVNVSICFTMNSNETCMVSKYSAAANHYLESWGDS
ncbi:MAG: TAT-variant-translocated molybdopterin oxidoreductase, partial [Eudoraea sp.]|nr:TAT-variant-translocated molybdopterin oxidoreductase [Eudoraea sp.]